jgi:hypothetical protein
MKLRALLQLATSFLAFALAAAAGAQESPYFVTYNHHMEEPGNLEVALSPVLGSPKQGSDSLATTLELEYGTRGWWTTALYLAGQSTSGQSSLFTGYRVENRFRLLMEEHWINPVFYVEFADVNGADKVLKEVVGFDSWHDQAEPNDEARREKKKEVETKLILSRDHQGWNVAGNFIAEKNLDGAPWEFGYALGASRPLALAASPNECRFCRENFSAGIEFYGGLGEWPRLSFANTSHYVAPALAWSLPDGLTVRVSPAFGITAPSNRSLIRVGVSYEISALPRRVQHLFR